MKWLRLALRAALIVSLVAALVPLPVQAGPPPATASDAIVAALPSGANGAAPQPVASSALADLRIEPVGTFGGAWEAVAVAGNYAYLGVGYRLAVVDLSNVSAPLIVGETASLPDTIVGVTVSDTTAYVAAGSAGLYLVDVSDAQHPAVLGSFDTPGEANEVAVAGSHAFVADGGSGLRVIDVSVPGNPQEVGALDTPGQAKAIVINTTYAYIADGDTVRIVDVSTPTAPVQRGVHTPSWSAWFMGIAYSGGYVYVTEGLGLTILDVSDPLNPAHVGQAMSVGTTATVTVAGDRAYVATAWHGVDVVDITNPAAPAVLGTYITSGDALDVALYGQRVVAAITHGMVILNVTNPAAISPAGSLDGTGRVTDVRFLDNHVYAAAYKSGLQVIDVADPNRMETTGRFDTANAASAVDASGTLAIVGDALGHILYFVDITDPTAPAQLAVLPVYDGAPDIDIHGSYAYVADDRYGLRIIDITDPASPADVGLLDTYYGALAVAVVGQTAYIADASGGLIVANVADPAAPVQIGFCDTPGIAADVAVVGNTAYVADSYAGLRVVDVSDPTHPAQVAYLPGISVTRVAMLGTLAVLVDSGSVRLVDVHDRTNPVALHAYAPPGTPQNLDVRGDLIYAATDIGGLAIMRITGFETVLLPMALMAMAAG